MLKNYTVDEATSTSSSTFGDLQGLLRSEYGYGNEDFLLYSYRGGFVDDSGIWYHDFYGKNDPISQDFRTTSLDALHDQLLVVR